MARRQLVNFHYENQLFDTSLTEFQIKKINKNFEYIALLWGGVEALYTLEDYPKEYLEKVKTITQESINLSSYRGETDYDSFWGDLSDLALARLVNSKETSFQIGQELKINPKGRIVSDYEELISLLHELSFPLVIRLNSSIAGRGVFRFYSQSELLESFNKIKNRFWSAGNIIIEPLYNRFLDFGVLYREKFYFYENLIDHRGQFRGIVIRPEHEFFQHLQLSLSPDELKNIYQLILDSYRRLGLKEIQVDSFLYQNQKGERCLYPLVEVNARKTMGEFALRIHDKLSYGADYGIFYMFKRSSSLIPKGSVLLSPETSEQRCAYAGFKSTDDFEKALKEYQSDISQRPAK